MGSSNGHPSPKFSVGYTGPAREELFRIAQSVTGTPNADLVRKAHREIYDKLQRDPNALGEPLYSIKSMKMSIRCVAVAPLYIEYGVHDVQPIVVIRRAVALSDPIS